MTLMEGNQEPTEYAADHPKFAVVESKMPRTSLPLLLQNDIKFSK